MADKLDHPTEERTGPVLVDLKSPPWPTLPDEALHGLAGDIVRTFEPDSEADSAAILVTALTMYGNCVGRSPHIYVGETRHGANIFAAIAGKSSRSRKGTSAAGPRRVFTAVDQRWAEERQISAIGSGEAIIWAVRDPSEPKVDKKGDSIVEDLGVTDKRLMILEEELSSLFTVSGRDGSIVGETIRKAWDGPSILFNTVKRSPVRATGAHVSIVGHITIDEVRRKLTETDKANGVANRLIWLVVKRSKVIANPERVPDDVVNRLSQKVYEAIDFGRGSGTVTLDTEARQLWEIVYPLLTVDHPGLFGAVVARAEVQVLRLALIYSAMDMSRAITPGHILSALALWGYCEESTRLIFGDKTGDGIADRIEDALRACPAGLTETSLHDFFGRHESSGRIKASLTMLQERRRVTMKEMPTGGRPARIWFAVSQSDDDRESADYLEAAREFVNGTVVSSLNSLNSQLIEEPEEGKDHAFF